MVFDFVMVGLELGLGGFAGFGCSVVCFSLPMLVALFAVLVVFWFWV